MRQSPEPISTAQILTAAQMRGAEDALMAAGTSVDELMQRAGRGAAEWVWRVAAHRAVTVLCGPGNNGGDGYVIAEALGERGGKVAVIAAADARTDAARTARALYQGEVLRPDAQVEGDVLVDCLFGSGLTRAVSGEHTALLQRLAASHSYAIAIDLPSGVEADSGRLLGSGLPTFDLTIALGAWKRAHFLMPASAAMGALRLVEIGVAGVPGAATLISRPQILPPLADSHKYRRGLLAVVGGAMPGAAILSARAAQGAGAGYVKLLAQHAAPVPADLVSDDTALAEAAFDPRIAAILVGPGLGRDAQARERLGITLAANVPAVLDADALLLLSPHGLAERAAPIIATPHEGELAALERAFACVGSGSKIERAAALARASGMVIVAKGPDTVIAAPDGRVACAARGPSWLSAAGTGDVLAGIIASRLACGDEVFAAACAGVWLHGEAARQCAPAFTAGQLADAVPRALGASL